jgi:hypothetical protein
MIREPKTTLQTRRSACRVVVPHRGAEPDDVAVGVDVRAFVLSPVSVLRQADRSASGLPLSREFVGVLDEEIGGGVPIGLLHKSEMNLGAITDGKAVPATFVLARGKAESPVMRKRGTEVADREYRRHSLRVAHQASLFRPRVRFIYRHSAGHSRSRGPAAQDASPGSFRC